MNYQKNPFYTYWMQWTLACGSGEFLGIASAAGFAVLHNYLLGEPSSIFGKIFNLAIMLVAGAIEGSILGFLQWIVLRKRFTRVPLGSWVLFTILVAMLGWGVGMSIPLFFLETGGESIPSEANIEPPLIIIFLLSSGLGLFLGSIFGVFQYFVLRKYAEKAWLWIVANALGWGLGLGWIYIAASIPDETTSLSLIIILGAIGGILTGFTVGMVTGWFQKYIIPNPK